MRYIVVSDLPEYTVVDNKTHRNLFPTKSGNRDYCGNSCSEETAKMIADALNTRPSVDVRGMEELREWIMVGIKEVDKGIEELKKYGNLQVNVDVLAGGKATLQDVLKRIDEALSTPDTKS